MRSQLERLGVGEVGDEVVEKLRVGDVRSQLDRLGMDDVG